MTKDHRIKEYPNLFIDDCHCHVELSSFSLFAWFSVLRVEVKMDMFDYITLMQITSPLKFRFEESTWKRVVFLYHISFLARAENF